MARPQDYFVVAMGHGGVSQRLVEIAVVLGIRREQDASDHLHDFFCLVNSIGSPSRAKSSMTCAPSSTPLVDKDGARPRHSTAHLLCYRRASYLFKICPNDIM